MKVREVIKLIEDDGWVLVAQRGSHRQFIHAMKPGRVTVAGNLGEDMRHGTLASVLRQAGLKGPRR
jgi:predicted RNA binding protein YcfA (HicA-like mRNA interferase family)